jgi:hypothetical protein
VRVEGEETSPLPACRVNEDGGGVSPTSVSLERREDSDGFEGEETSPLPVSVVWVMVGAGFPRPRHPGNEGMFLVGYEDKRP